MDNCDARLSELLTLPQFAQACINVVHPEHGLKLLRLVCKDVKEALLQYVSRYSGRWELGGSSQPGFVDAIRLLRKTRLSSLRVNIVVGEGSCEQGCSACSVSFFQRFISSFLPMHVHEVASKLLPFECLQRIIAIATDRIVRGWHCAM